MHSAPAVRYPVLRSVRAGCVVAALCALPVLAWIVAWMAGLSAAALAVVAAIWLAACGVAVLQWRGMRLGRLRWDGQAWWWQPDEPMHADEHAVSVDLRLDFQSAMLVRTVGASVGAGWCWLDRAAAPARWGDLRRALHQRGAVRSAAEPLR